MGSSSTGKAVAPGSFPNGGAPAAGWRNAVAHRTVTAEATAIVLAVLWAGAAAAERVLRENTGTLAPKLQPTTGSGPARKVRMSRRGSLPRPPHSPPCRGRKARNDALSRAPGLE